MSFIELATLAEKEIISGFHGKFAHTENMTLSFWRIEKGAKLPEHAHPQEQISAVISGQFEMRLNGETMVLEKGKIALIPANITHSGRALTDCEIMDIFSPLREDYK